MRHWFAAFCVVLLCGLCTMLSRDVILSLRFYSAPLDPVVRRTITRLGCALPANCYRGCRGGRRVRARASVYKHCDVISPSYSEPQPIPTVIELRSSHSIHARPSCRPVRRRQPTLVSVSRHSKPKMFV